MCRMKCGPGDAYDLSECRKGKREEDEVRAVLVNEIKTLRYVRVVNWVKVFVQECVS
jgi:hypothetical protein